MILQENKEKNCNNERKFLSEGIVFDLFLSIRSKNKTTIFNKQESNMKLYGCLACNYDLAFDRISNYLSCHCIYG